MELGATPGSAGWVCEGSAQLRCARGRCALVGTGPASLLAHTSPLLPAGEEACLVSQCFFPPGFVPLRPSCPLLSYPPPPAGNDSSWMIVWLAGSGILPRKGAEVTQFSE